MKSIPLYMCDYQRNKECTKENCIWADLPIHSCHNGHDMNMIGAAYDPTDNTVVIFDGPGTASAIGYVEIPKEYCIRHARWDDSFDGITPYCTDCHRTHRCMVRTPDWCPNCGAKMDLPDMTRTEEQQP